MRIAITGAAGHLGRHVIESLLARGVAAQDLVAIVRTASKAEDLTARGITVAEAPYEDVAALTEALQGVDRLVLVSGSEVGKRAAQHTNVLEAAKAAGVAFIAYTSLLNAETSGLSLAPEHRDTEALLAASGIDHVLLRNGWYWENFASNVDAARATGHVFGAAGEGRVNGAARRDYAEAAAVVVTTDGHAGKTYELGGQPSLTYPEIAQAVGTVIGAEVSYVNQSVEEYQQTLEGAGLPAEVAQMIAGWDVAIAGGALETASTDLEDLIGRPATSLAEALAA
ncbi:MAG TPA: SDR family oxidoreductase [Candidatus Brevibacterium intestinigallinarum]|nr:SDR family oxidoreductase [Candidatus Brevibacterium intestinigallinarum]